MPTADVITEKSLLSKLKSRVKAAAISGKITFVPRDKIRFTCPNHSTKTVISLHNMEEFECDCGIIYKKDAQ